MIKIVTDSTAYVTSEYADAHDIKVVPLYIITKNDTIKEGFPGSFDDIFESIIKEEETIKSSQPSPESFKSAFDEILKEGNEVVCITISSSLSGTYNSAVLAAKMYAKNVYFSGGDYKQDYDYSFGLTAIILDLQVIANRKLEEE